MVLNTDTDSLIQKVSQQELGRHFNLNDKMIFALARACLPHCVEVGDELLTGSTKSLGELVEFIDRHGAHRANGSHDTKYYRESEGWIMAALANKKRSEGFAVVVQNMNYALGQTDLEAAMNSGRISTELEADTMKHLSSYGGKDRNGWIDAITEQLSKDVVVIPSITIPTSTGIGEARHGVVVLGVNEDTVTYFDPDKLALSRYSDNNFDIPGIVPMHRDGKLVYEQTRAEFTARLNGEMLFMSRREDAA